MLSVQSYALRVFAALAGCLCITWAALNLDRAAASGDFWDTESRLLRFESVNRTTAETTLESDVAKDLSGCDNHAQRTLLLMELPLADAALRSGSTSEFDRRIKSLERRSRRILTCNPRDSFAWLVAFALEIAHGSLNEQTFGLLSTSYDTSSNEAWMGLRRIVAAIPVLRTAPELTQIKILSEFQMLIENNFLDVPARSYLNASASTQQLLRSQIERLNPQAQRRFSETLQAIQP